MERAPHSTSIYWILELCECNNWGARPMCESTLHPFGRFWNQFADPSAVSGQGWNRWSHSLKRGVLPLRYTKTPQFALMGAQFGSKQINRKEQQKSNSRNKKWCAREGRSSHLTTGLLAFSLVSRWRIVASWFQDRCSLVGRRRTHSRGCRSDYRTLPTASASMSSWLSNTRDIQLFPKKPVQCWSKVARKF